MSLNNLNTQHMINNLSTKLSAIDHHGFKVDIIIQPTAAIKNIMIPLSIYNDDYIFHPPEEE